MMELDDNISYGAAAAVKATTDKTCFFFFRFVFNCINTYGSLSEYGTGTVPVLYRTVPGPREAHTVRYRYRIVPVHYGKVTYRTVLHGECAEAECCMHAYTYDTVRSRTVRYLYGMYKDPYRPY